MSASSEMDENFLRQFRDAKTRELLPFTATHFMEVWEHYDVDGNGYIEGSELDKFFRELVSSVNAAKVGSEVVSEHALSLMRETFMSAYDDNEDSRIDIVEMAGILPTEENFLLLFRRDHPLDSSEDFMKIWRKFDANCNGLIEANELKNFLRSLLEAANKETKVSNEKLQEYTDTMLKLFDRNHDGKLHLSEMAKLLRVKENYLRKPVFKHPQRITRRTLDILFTRYDSNRDGTIEDDELSGFIKDLFDTIREGADANPKYEPGVADSSNPDPEEEGVEQETRDYTLEDVDRIRTVILDHWDLNKDGKLSRSELRMLLMEQASLVEACGHNTHI